MKNKALYYILNLTWGLPLTLVGAVVALVLMIFGKMPHMYGPCVHFELGKRWGGVSLGLFIFTCTDVSSDIVKKHELGHTIQNAIFGPLMIPLALVSVGRYWMETLFNVWFPYGDYWLEQDATEIGKSCMEYYEEA